MTQNPERTSAQFEHVGYKMVQAPASSNKVASKNHQQLSVMSETKNIKVLYL